MPQTPVKLLNGSPRTGPGIGTAGEWDLAGNIKGPPGDVTGIPDPLTVDVVHANTRVEVGGKFRLVGTATGGQVQVLIGVTWTVVAEWP